MGYGACTYVVSDANRKVHLEWLVVDFVLQLPLFTLELRADSVTRGVVLGRGKLGRHLCLERALCLCDELGAGVRPRRKLGGGDGDLCAREVADLDLRLDLRLDEGKQRLVEPRRDLDKALGCGRCTKAWRRESKLQRVICKATGTLGRGCAIQGVVLTHHRDFAHLW